MRGAKLSAGKVVKARRLRQQETTAEHRLWNMLRDRRFQGLKFVRQYPVGRYVADFVCRERMLIIEVDGGQHAESEQDVVRTTFLNGRGYSVLRFWNNEVLRDIEGCWQVLNEIALGNPSPDRRFAPATLSPGGRGNLTATPEHQE